MIFHILGIFEEKRLQVSPHQVQKIAVGCKAAAHRSHGPAKQLLGPGGQSGQAVLACGRQSNAAGPWAAGCPTLVSPAKCHTQIEAFESLEATAANAAVAGNIEAAVAALETNKKASFSIMFTWHNCAERVLVADCCNLVPRQTSCSWTGCFRRLAS